MLSARNVKEGHIDWSEDYSYISEDDFLELNKANPIEDQDILLTIVGTIGRASVNRESTPFTVQRSVAIIKTFIEHIDPYYLQHLFNGPKFQKLLEQNSKGTAQKGVYLTPLKNLQIPLAPLPEQHRIVARIEELFSRLDAGVEALRRAKSQLQRYRQSVLQAAVTGRLTAEWRAAHKANSDINEIIAQPSLPEGWIWARYDQLGKWSGGGTPSKRIVSYWTNGSIPWISPKDMKSQKIYDSQDKITKEAIQNSSAKLIPSGSLLFVVRSGIIQRTLPVASLKVEAAVNQDLKALTPNESVNEDYLLYSTIALGENIRHHCSKDGTTVQSIEFKLLRDFTIPIPPLEEQQEIVDKIERHEFSLIEVEELIDANLIHTVRLRQSILKRAFQGRLVPQDPDDEPASKLLKRILDEKARRMREPKLIKRPKRRDYAMSKMRSGLYETLVEAKTQLTPEDLFNKAGFQKEMIDEFYQELREEVNQMKIIEIRPNKTDVYLKVVENENK